MRSWNFSFRPSHCIMYIIRVTSWEYMFQNCKTLAGICSWTGRFESYLIANPEDKFSYDVAHSVNASLMQAYLKNLKNLVPQNYPKIWTNSILSKRCRQNGKQCTPDQTVSEAIWSGSTLFAQNCLFENLGSSWYISNEPHHEKTCLCYMRTTKAQISLRIRAVWSAPLLFTA